MNDIILKYDVWTIVLRLFHSHTHWSEFYIDFSYDNGYQKSLGSYEQISLKSVVTSDHAHFLYSVFFEKVSSTKTNILDNISSYWQRHYTTHTTEKHRKTPFLWRH